MGPATVCDGEGVRSSPFASAGRFSTAALQRSMASSILSVSGTELDCDDVVRYMARMGITGDVTANTSVLPGGAVEKGCRVQLSKGATEGGGAQRIFARLRAEGKVECGHVVVRQHAEGCVFDVWRETACPSAQQEE